MFIIIECDIPAEGVEDVCTELSEMLNSNVRLGMGGVGGWKIPTEEDWG
jgi:hypothetical protein